MSDRQDSLLSPSFIGFVLRMKCIILNKQSLQTMSFGFLFSCFYLFFLFLQYSQCHALAGIGDVWCERKFKVLYHLHGGTGWFTIWANGKQEHRIEIPNEISRVPFTRIYLEQLELSWVITYMGRNWRKANGNDIFYSHFPVVNFGLPFDPFRLFWKFSAWTIYNSLAIYHLIHRRNNPTWAKSGTVGKCLAQEHNAQRSAPARARIWTARSGVRRNEPLDDRVSQF